MRILDLHINRFGGLSNLTLTPEMGLNLILGHNEDGKSTIMAFIRAMFYGFSGRSTSLKINDRKRLMPWDQANMGGWLVFEFTGRRYRIERSFGNARQQDRSVLRDDTTAVPIDLPARQEIGDYLFHVSEQEFVNTVFINQLATANVTPDGGTLAKLTNLATTGDERVSSDEIDSILRKSMVRLKAEKGNGGLLNYQISQQNQLSGERFTVLQKEQERVDLIHLFQQLTNLREHTVQNLADGQSLLNACQDWFVLSQSDRIAKLNSELQQLQQEITNLKDRLIWDGQAIDRPFIAELRMQLANLTAEKARIDEVERQHNQLLDDQIRLSKSMQSFQLIAAIDAAQLESFIEEQGLWEHDLLVARQISIGLKELLGEQAEIQAVINQAESKRTQCARELNDFQVQMNYEFQQITDEIAAREAVIDSQKQELAKLKNNPQRLISLQRFMILGLVCGTSLLIAGLAIGWLVDPLAYILAPIGLAICLYFGLRAQKMTQTNISLHSIERATLTRLLHAAEQALEESRKRQKNVQVQSEQREIQLVAQNTISKNAFDQAVAREKQASDGWNQNLLNVARDSVWSRYPDTLRMNFDLQNITPAVLTDELRKLTINIQMKLESVNDYLSRALCDAACSSLNEFRLKINTFRDIQGQELRLKKILERSTDEVTDAVTRQVANREKLMRTLRVLFPECTSAQPDIIIDYLAQLLNQLESMQITYSERLTNLNALNGGQRTDQITAEASLIRTKMESDYPNAPHDLLQALLKFLNEIEQIELTSIASSDPVPICQPMMINISSFSERLAQKVESIRTRVHELENNAIRAESDLRIRFASMRNLDDIDTEIRQNAERIRQMQLEYDALNLARNTFSEAFSNLQQSFGPHLNKRSGAILAELTGDRYQEVRIDRNFNIHVAEPDSGVLREWEYLSGGTIDQVYLSLRLAVAELIGNREDRLPLCFDDIFIQYDDSRSLAGMDFLSRYAKEQNIQVLLFTCHKRLTELTEVTPICI